MNTFSPTHIQAISIVKSLLMVLTTFGLVSCSYIDLKPFSEQSQMIRDLKKRCDNTHSQLKPALKALINKHRNASDDVFIREFDLLYFQTSKNWFNYKSLAVMHDIPQYRSTYLSCALTFKTLFDHQLSSNELYIRFIPISESESEPLRHYAEKAMNAMQRSGAHLPKEQQNQLAIARTNERNLRKRFHIAASNDHRVINIDEEADLKPEAHLIQHIKANEITTSDKEYYPLLSNSENERLRQTLYEKKYQVGHPINEDNLKYLLRNQETSARILGYDNYAAFLASNTTMQNTLNIQTYLKHFNTHNSPRLTNSLEYLKKETLNYHSKDAQVQAWDIPLLRKRSIEAIQKKNASEKSKSIDLFSTTLQMISHIYGIEYQAIDSTIATPNTKSYMLYRNNKSIGMLHTHTSQDTDKAPYAQTLIVNPGLKNESMPEVALSSNINHAGDFFNLQTFYDLNMLFHEWGHILQVVFSGQSTYALHNALSTEIDFIEVPAAMHDHWFKSGQWIDHIALTPKEREQAKALLRDISQHHALFRPIKQQESIAEALLALQFSLKDTRGLNIEQTEKKALAAYHPFYSHIPTGFYGSFTNFIDFNAYLYSDTWSYQLAAFIDSTLMKKNRIEAEKINTYIDALLRSGHLNTTQKLSVLLGKPQSLDALIQKVSQVF